MFGRSGEGIQCATESNGLWNPPGYKSFRTLAYQTPGLHGALVMAGLVVQPGDIPDRCSQTWLTPEGMVFRLYWRPAMPFAEMSVMDQRLEFVRLASVEGANRRELCRRYGISADTGYKWIGRYADGQGDLSDRSRRPLYSPTRSSSALEDAVMAVRSEHPAWGARKIAALLRREGLQAGAFHCARDIGSARMHRAAGRWRARHRPV